MPPRTSDAMVERGVVSAYDLQIFLEVSGYSVDSTVDGDFDGKLGPKTQRALSAWITDYTEANTVAEISTIPSADGRFVTFTPASLAKPIVFTARDVDLDEFLGRESRPNVPVASGGSDVVVPKKPFFRMDNPWLWAGVVAVVGGGGYYAYQRGLIPGLGGYGMGRTAIQRGRAPSNADLWSLMGVTSGLLLAVTGAAAWSYGKWANRVDASVSLEHRQAVQTNGTIMVLIGLSTAGAAYIYRRTL